MITGKKISDAVINCKIIKTIPTTQNQQRNVSQYFVNKNIKILPEPTSNNHQIISQKKNEQIKLQNSKQNQISNQIQTIKCQKSQNSIQNCKTTIKNQRKIVQKSKNNLVNEKKNQTQKVNANLKEIKKIPTIQASKSMKLLNKEQVKVNNQIKVQKKAQDKDNLPKKVSDNTIIKVENKKQNEVKSQKEIKNQIIKDEKPKNMAKQQKLSVKQQISNSNKNDKKQSKIQNLFKAKAEQMPSKKSIQFNKKQEVLIQSKNNDLSDLQYEQEEQERMIPTPIQIQNQDELDCQESHIAKSQTQINQSQAKIQQEVSFNQFLSSDLVYSKIQHRIQQQECFINQNDSICLFKQQPRQTECEIKANQVQKVQKSSPFERSNETEQKQQNFHKNNASMQNEPMQDSDQQNQQEQPLFQIDQNYLNFNLSFEQTLLINNDINKSLDYKQNILTHQYQQKNQSMLLEQNNGQSISNSIYEKDNDILNQNSQQIKNIIKSITFSQALPRQYTNFKYYESSDEEQEEEDEQQKNQQNQDILQLKSINQKPLIKKTQHKVQNVQPYKSRDISANIKKGPIIQLKQQNQNSSQQQSQGENQAIQEYLRARNMVTVDKPKAEYVKQQYSHHTNKITQNQNNTIIEQSCQEDSSLLILENSKQSLNDSQISQELNNMQLFSLGMEELMKKNFIMI